jgi:hypothetical protein
LTFLYFPLEGGNKLGEKKGMIEGALRRAIAQDDGVRLRRMVEAILDKAADGELSHVAWIADRLDGKAKQQVDIGSGREPIRVELTDTSALGAEVRKLVRGVVPGVVEDREEGRGEGAGKA